MMVAAEPLYTTRIIKAGALLADTKVLLANWNDDLDVDRNFQEARSRNLFGKASRARVQEVLAALRLRYFTDPQIVRGLVSLFRNGVAGRMLNQVLYFHAVRTDRLLHDVVTEVLDPLREEGITEVSVPGIVTVLMQWSEEGKTAGRWSRPTAGRVAQGALSTLRDFGVLEGKVRKRIASPYIPPAVVAYVAFTLVGRHGITGLGLLQHRTWRVFFLSAKGVEQALLQAHQEGLLQYYSAGSVVRIEFPTSDIKEYAHALAKGPHRSP